MKIQISTKDTNQSFPRQKKEEKSYVDCFKSLFLTSSKKQRTGVKLNKGKNKLFLQGTKGKNQRRNRLRKGRSQEEHSLKSLSTQNELTLT